MEIKIINGFIWATLKASEAKEAFNTDNEIFILHEDESESLIESYEDFKMAKFDNKTFGIELGNESELKSEWEEARDRNNDKRSFEAWIEDKAENLIY